MCTSLFLWDSHPELVLLLLFNRDEFFHRCDRQCVTSFTTFVGLCAGFTHLLSC